MTIRSTFRLRLFGILLALVLVCLAALPYVSSQQANNAVNLITTAQAKDTSYEKVLSLLKDAETGQRGFLIARDESFLAPYHSGVTALPLVLEEISTLAQSKQEKELVENITLLSQEKIAEMGRTIELRRAGRDSDAFNMVAGGEESA